ncbi:MAG: TonB-dependent receptor [Bacteroidetes bacterium]|nr:TonB-dependent receptor [Bacteroidota bacterium]MBS1974027.1 TonB-dependent receptor [Bacteroidota bacterium]
MKKINLLILLLPLMLVSIGSMAQTRAITGTVTDSQTGEPIAGATVKVLNSKIGTAADEKGAFKIQIPSSVSKVVLSVSGIGYATAEVNPKDDNVVVKLISANKQLNDVVVVGYGTAKKATLTGSISTIKSKEVTEAPVTNVSNGLAGRLPGLVAVTSSSEPGYDGTTLRIRGSNTFNDNSVLVVIDGVPDRSLERIDPYSIESITVLKDASAAIYGSRAANGVILVTTKRGRTGKPEITFNGNFGYNQPTKLPKMANAPLYATALNEIAYYNNPSGGLNQTYTAAQIQKFKDGSDPLRYPNTDWFKETLKPMSAQNNENIAITGGTESMRYFVSLDVKHQDGQYKNSATYYNQYGFTSNVDGKISKDIRVGVDIKGRLEDRHFPQKSAGTIFSNLVSSYPTSVAWWPNGLPGPARENGTNPVVISTGATGYNNDKYYVLNTNLRLDVNIPWINGLTFNGNLSYDQGFDFDKNFTKPWRLYSWDGTTVDSKGQPVLFSNVFGAGANNSPSLYESFQSNYSKLAYGLLNYQTKIGENNSLKLMLGAQVSNGNTESFNAYRDLFASTAVQEMFAGTTANQATGGSGTVNARLSYFGRANYSYANKYLLEFVGRYDGSYIFAPGHRFGFFPGVSLGWVTSEENFWKDNVKFIDYFKLRASWGQTGNDRVADFQYLTSYLFGSSYYPNSSGYYYPFVVNAASALSELQTVYESVIANPNITWEVANQSNIGFNASFLNSKLTVEADYFYYKRSNILWPQNATVPSSAGLSLPSVNYGKAQNQGFDFTITYSNSTRSKLNYSISFNGGYAQNKVLQWGEAPGAPVWQQTTGHPMGSALFYVADGVIHDSKDSAAYAGSFKSWGLSTPPAPGDIRYVDIAKNDTMDSRQQTRIYKSSIPTFTFGANINLSYKNVDLALLFQGATGAVMYVNSDGGTFTNFRESLLDGRWSPTNPNGNIPRTPNRGNYYWDNTSNTFFLHKTNYVRLKTLQLGYTIDTRNFQKTGIKNVRVYVSGQNLLTWCPGLKDFDPELGADTNPRDGAPGISGANYPLSRVVSMGLTVTF